jgi:hypothetical protein
MYIPKTPAKFFIIAVSSLFLLNSCKNEKLTKNSLKDKIQKDNVAQNKEIGNAFLTGYDSIKKSESKTFEILTDKFFNDKKPSIKYYALFCNFCLYENKDESLSEEFSLYTFELFKKDKTKSEILIKYIYQLKEKERDTILSSVIKLMCLDLGDNEYNIEKFNTDFKSLSKNKEVQKTVKKCLDDVVF